VGTTTLSDDVVLGSSNADVVAVNGELTTNLIFRSGLGNRLVQVATAAANTAGNILTIAAGGGGASNGSAAGGAGAFTQLISGSGGAGSGAFAGGVGGLANVRGGNGGAGTASAVAGAGGGLQLFGGNAGATGGGVGANGGDVEIFGGTRQGDANRNGDIYIGHQNTNSIVVGLDTGAIQNVYFRSGTILNFNTISTVVSTVAPWSLTTPGSLATLTLNQTGSGLILDVQDGGVSVFTVADGGTATFTGNVVIGDNSTVDTLNVSNTRINSNLRFTAFNKVISADAPTTDTGQGAFTFRGGDGWSSNGATNGRIGGLTSIRGGTGGSGVAGFADGAGGNVQILGGGSGVGGTTTAAGGNVVIDGGFGSNGTYGSVAIGSVSTGGVFIGVGTPGPYNNTTFQGPGSIVTFEGAIVAAGTTTLNGSVVLGDTSGAAGDTIAANGEFTTNIVFRRGGNRFVTVGTAAANTNGNVLTVTAGYGGEAIGGNAGASGLLQIYPGNGGLGAAGFQPGGGGMLLLRGGDAGLLNGGVGGGNGGSIELRAGIASGTGTEGDIIIGENSRGNILIGSTTFSTPVTIYDNVTIFSGAGLTVQSAASSMTANGNGTTALTVNNALNGMSLQVQRGGVDIFNVGTNDIVNIGTLSAHVVNIVARVGSSLQFVSGGGRTINIAQSGADAAGFALTLSGSTGGNAGVSGGGTGGSVNLNAANGGDGTASLPAGAGGTTVLAGGAAGINNGGGGSGGGDIFIRAGAASGAGLIGQITLGDVSTRAINLGNAAQNTTITQTGTGLVTLNGDVVMNGAVALGNATTDDVGVNGDVTTNIVFRNGLGTRNIQMRAAATATTGNAVVVTGGAGGVSDGVSIGGTGGNSQITAGSGGSASGSIVGGNGGIAVVRGGAGGAGTATAAGAAGGGITVQGGAPGTDGGAGRGLGGLVEIYGGNGDALANHGEVLIGTSTTRQITIGNGSTPTFLSSNVITFNGLTSVESTVAKWTLTSLGFGAVLTVNQTGVGESVDFQTAGTSRFKINNNGSVTISAAQASTWGTAAGDLTLQAAGGTVLTLSSGLATFPGNVTVQGNTILGDSTYNGTDFGVGADTYRLGGYELSGLFIFADDSLNNAGRKNIGSQRRTVVGAIGRSTTLHGQPAGNADASTPGGKGGQGVINGGGGGGGTTTQLAGAGGDTIVRGGVAGVDNGGGGAVGGDSYVRGGMPSGVAANGRVYIGETVTSGIFIGPATGSGITANTTFQGTQNTVTIESPVVLASAVVSDDLRVDGAVSTLASGGVITADDVQTTNATQTTLTSVTLANNTVYRFTAQIIARDTSGTDRAYYIVNTLVYRQGGGATLGTVNMQLIDETAGALAWDATFTVSGNDLRLSVTGLAATTIDWGCTLTYQSVS